MNKFKRVNQLQKYYEGCKPLKDFNRNYDKSYWVKACREYDIEYPKMGSEGVDSIYFSPPYFVVPHTIFGRFLGLEFRSPSGDKYAKLTPFDFTCYCPKDTNEASDQFQYGDPIILVEGTMDAEALVREYPFVVASMTSVPSHTLCAALSIMTDTFYLVPDSDQYGQESVSKFEERMEKVTDRSHFIAEVECPYDDPGEFFSIKPDERFRWKSFVNRLMNQISKRSSINVPKRKQTNQG